MSAHASKGLEFNCVFVCGLEDGTFPSFFSNATYVPDEAFFEERRLFFVALTRAKQKLFLSAAQRLGGSTDGNWVPPSRFISEIEDTITCI